MTSVLSIIALGFLLGVRHATDPDHVIAVTTILNRERQSRHAALTAVLWGIGHTLTIVAVGAAIILFNLVIPDRVGLGMELTVGLMLIILGVMNIVSFVNLRPSAWLGARGESRVVHAHAHSHGDYIHTHPHGHEPDEHPHPAEQTPLAAIDHRLGGLRLYEHVRPVVVGIVHGLAGSAAVTLVVLAAIRDPGWAMAYLLVFGVGTIAGMMLVTLSIASAFRYAGRRSDTLGRRLGLVTGLASVGFGLFMAYEIGIGQGLLLF